MCDPDSGRGLVDVLTARAAGSVGINLQIIISDIYLYSVIYFRHDINRTEGCLPLAVCIERGNTYKSVNTMLGLEIAVSMITVHLEGNGLDSGLITRKIIEFLYAEALCSCPSGVHTIEHGNPVTAFGSARSGVNGNNCVICIKFA